VTYPKGYNPPPSPKKKVNKGIIVYIVIEGIIAIALFFGIKQNVESNFE
jgi:hypothetical protein